MVLHCIVGKPSCAAGYRLTLHARSRQAAFHGVNSFLAVVSCFF